MSASSATHISNKLQEPVQFLVFSASLRGTSLNSELASHAARVIEQHGGIANEQLRRRFELTIQAFMDLAEASKKYPCAKKAWFEYLGEQPEAITARAQ